MTVEYRYVEKPDVTQCDVRQAAGLSENKFIYCRRVHELRPAWKRLCNCTDAHVIIASWHNVAFWRRTPPELVVPPRNVRCMRESYELQ